MFWNFQGTGHPRFHSFVKEYRRDFALDLFCLMETRLSGNRADDIISKLGYQNSFIIEPISKGRSVFWFQQFMLVLKLQKGKSCGNF